MKFSEFHKLPYSQVYLEKIFQSNSEKEVYQQASIKLNDADKDIAAILIENKSKKSVVSPFPFCAEIDDGYKESAL